MTTSLLLSRSAYDDYAASHKEEIAVIDKLVSEAYAIACSRLIYSVPKGAIRSAVIAASERHGVNPRALYTSIRRAATKERYYNRGLALLMARTCAADCGSWQKHLAALAF